MSLASAARSFSGHLRRCLIRPGALAGAHAARSASAVDSGGAGICGNASNAWPQPRNAAAGASPRQEASCAQSAGRVRCARATSGCAASGCSGGLRSHRYSRLPPKDDSTTGANAGGAHSRAHAPLRMPNPPAIAAHAAVRFPHIRSK